MKSIFAALLLVIATLVLSGCESDVPPSAADEAAAEKLRRGVTGQGTIVQPDRSEDPVIREQTRVGY
jgi:hypothetical protein